ncbi:MAG: YihY/virulence factor BrkB family protein [Coprococcus sp.]
MKKVINICRRIALQIKRDQVGVFAAQAAFFLMLSVFPFIMMLVTVVRYLPFEQADIIAAIQNFMPKNISQYFSFMTQDIYNAEIGIGAVVSMLLMVWSASKGTMSIGAGLTYMDEMLDSKNYFLRRAIHAIYTVVFCAMLIVIIIIYILGDFIMERFILNSSIAEIAAWILAIVKLGLGPILVFTVILVAYCFLPARKCSVMRSVPGAIFTTVGWIGISVAFSIYVKVVGVNTYMYGSLASIIFIILWLYFCMYTLFLGAEVNKILEKGLLTQL